MAKYNPFFEKAGMQPIAQSKPSKATTEALANLERLDFETALLPNTTYVQERISTVGSEPILSLLEELSRKDASVRKRLANLQAIYPKHEEFTQKIRTFNEAHLAQALKRLSFAAQSKVYLFWKNPETCRQTKS